MIIRVKRGINPHWYSIAEQANRGDTKALAWLHNEGIHASEYSWAGTHFDAEIDNDGSIDSLYAKVRDLVQDPLDANERPLYVGLADSSRISS